MRTFCMTRKQVGERIYHLVMHVRVKFPRMFENMSTNDVDVVRVFVRYRSECMSGFDGLGEGYICEYVTFCIGGLGSLTS